MFEDGIKTGDRIEISSKNIGQRGPIFASRVENIIGKDKLIAHVPIAHGRLVKLPLERPYVFTFFTDQGMLQLEAMIINYFDEDGFHMLEARMLTSAQKYQRREFYRFECGIKFKLGVLTKNYNIATNMPRPQMYDAITQDISAGGVKCIANDFMEENDRVRCVIPLGKENLYTLAKVLHKHKLKASENVQYRIMFLDLTAEEKDKIVKYIFIEQRKALKNK